MARFNPEDRQQITDLIYRYCRAVDRLDIALGQSIWHEDATADYGEDYYQGPGKGVIELICKHHLATTGHSHQVTNILIEPDGDRASSESYCIAALRVLHNGTHSQITVWTRYIDRWSRRNGVWGLEHRIAVKDFDEIRSVTPLTQTTMGRRDMSDPSYGAFNFQDFTR
jgi:hypothetical protein